MMEFELIMEMKQMLMNLLTIIERLQWYELLRGSGSA